MVSEKNQLVPTWCRNFPLRAFSDTRTENISNRVQRLTKMGLQRKNFAPGWWASGKIYKDEILQGASLHQYTVGFFILSQPERKLLNSKIETKHYKDFLWITAIKTPLKTDDFVNFSLKSSSEQKLYRFENWNFPHGLA